MQSGNFAKALSQSGEKWFANLIRRVNFEFANPVEIRKVCEFEDRELEFSKMIIRVLQRIRIPYVILHKVRS